MGTPVPKDWVLNPDGQDLLNMYPDSAPPAGPFPTDQELRNYGFLLAKDYGVTSASSDNAVQLQAWIDDGKAQNKPGYLHYSASPYLTSKALGVIQRISFNGQADVSIPFENGQLVGGKNPSGGGERPVIKLTVNASPFGDINDLCPVLTWAAVGPINSGGTPLYEMPDNPLHLPTGWKWATGDLYGAQLMGIDIDTSGHVGAIGLWMPGAQNCGMANVKVVATGSARGISCFPATDYPSMNIEVVGGEVGVDFSYLVPGTSNPAGSAASELIVGLKITGATIPLQSTFLYSPATIVGFEIECPGTVYTPQSGYATSNCITLVDGKITITGGGNPFAFLNPNDKQMYLRDVYVTGTDNLVQTGGEAPVTGTGAWKKIKEYVSNDPRAFATDVTNPTRSLINGVQSSVQEPSTIIENSVAAPPSDILTRHVSTIPTVDDGLAFVDAVGVYGLDNTGVVDSRASLQNALDAVGRVFLRKGTYATGKNPSGDYGLLLNSGNVLFGLFPGPLSFYSASGAGTFLRPSSDWNPTEGTPVLIKTVDTAVGSAVVSNIGLFLKGGGGSPNESTAPLYERFGGIHWEIGDGFVWGVTYTNQYLDQKAPTNPRTALAISGNGAGKFYGSGLNERRWGNQQCKIISIEGPNTGPCLIYGLNGEISKGAPTGTDTLAYFTIDDADNVWVFNTKRESGAATVIATNCQNIAYFGLGVMDSDRRDIYQYYGTSDNLLIGMGCHRNNTSDPTPASKTIREDVGFGAITMDGVYNVSVYKRGEADIDAMFGG